jgi:hypothetical protein
MTKLLAIPVIIVAAVTACSGLAGCGSSHSKTSDGDDSPVVIVKTKTVEVPTGPNWEAVFNTCWRQYQDGAYCRSQADIIAGHR